MQTLDEMLKSILTRPRRGKPCGDPRVLESSIHKSPLTDGDNVGTSERYQIPKLSSNVTMLLRLEIEENTRRRYSISKSNVLCRRAVINHIGMVSPGQTCGMVFSNSSGGIGPGSNAVGRDQINSGIELSELGQQSHFSEVETKLVQHKRMCSVIIMDNLNTIIYNLDMELDEGWEIFE
ncbi:hypothetical protein BJ165DRAFT_1400004 [Panaeolus papilionaceus]|nr:hypothetical protein BJ165DRAFT_1400004 [Panaeolus papilionaceus]